MSKPNNIWKHDKNLPEDKLIAYLEGKLSPKEQHEVELFLANEGPENDAVEGLKDLRPGETKKMIAQLNRQLAKDLTGKRKKRRGSANNNGLQWLAIFIILLLCIMGYAVIHLLLHKGFLTSCTSIIN